MNLAMFSAVFCCFVIKGLRASVLSVKPVSFPLPRSLSRYAPVVRLRRAAGACIEKLEKTERSKEEKEEKKERPRRCRFSIGAAPLTSIAETDAQISGGETRQDYKDTRRFPLAAPSCALLFLPFGLPVSLRCYGRVYLIPRLTLSSG
ncbi:plasmid replication initiation protein (plasmid) [Klebsiella pneumoniae]|nr:plasmid replication initiation protein [Klebsiella pneumoniae]